MRFFYELSAEADHDLEDIFDYTAHEFGPDQAIRYLSSFDKIFDCLLENPELGRARKEIHAGLRSIVNGSYVVFYRIKRDRIRIVRILHAAQDLHNLFDE